MNKHNLNEIKDLKEMFVNTTNVLYNVLNDLNNKTNEVETLKQENINLSNSLNNKTNEVETLKQENINLSNSLNNKTNEVETLLNNQKESVNFLLELSNTKLFRFAHFVTRLKQQGLSKNLTDRKYFLKWLLGDNNQKTNHQYNPLFTAIELSGYNNKTQNINDSSLNKINDLFGDKDYNYEILNKEYKKMDIIIFSIIDYDFRFQRPQHFAKRFAEQGHRVFYINANFSNIYSEEVKDENIKIITLCDNRFSIHQTDFREDINDIQKNIDRIIHENFISDACIIVDYPNWINLAINTKKKYGFKLVTDYMDDFGGFINPVAEIVKKNCFDLLRVSDKVIASSDYLYKCARQYNGNVSIIRNGTEYNYFNKAYKNSEKKPNERIIGYYGAISTWFDMNIVCECAKYFPNNKIVLIGEISTNDDRYKNYNNIITLGEKPYNELVNYLEDFDVCIIPFDTSTELIKATNPVKFYEYLSAGKKIVATEIPELMPYKDKYVYLENDPKKFCEKVKLCIDNDDLLINEDSIFEFAKENDWDNRANELMSQINDLYKKISIIILCYNNIDLTKKCVDSILNNTAYPNYEIVLVDNNSSDGTSNYLKHLKDNHNNVKIILNKTNRGFAGGNNDGLKIAEGDYLVLLNNDVEVTRGWLSTFVKHLEKDENLGMIGPVTNSIGNEAKIFTSYSNMNEMKRFAFEYVIQHLNEEYCDIRVLAMFCLMMKREVYETIGPLDENYGIGMFEDDDYSINAKKHGYSIAIAEDVFVHHYGSESFKKIDDANRMLLFNKNREYYEKKWKEKWIQHKYRNLFMPTTGEQWIKAYIKNNAQTSKICNHILNEFNQYDDVNDSCYIFNKILDSNRNKKIIVYPFVIDWLPFQTPQYLLEAFAQKGYLCVFCYQNSINDVDELEKNIYGVSEKTFLNCIGERPCTVLLTWVGSVPFANKIKNKKIWYHIVDKLSIFAFYDNNYEYLSQLIVQSADVISYVSKQLMRYVPMGNGIYLPNAANPIQILEDIDKNYIPKDIEGIVAKNTNIIGYFGWISRWFDFDIIAKIAAKEKNVDFVFIGPVDEYDNNVIKKVNELSILNNVHFLGKKNHRELPNYAKFFSICLIPFLINDEMDCVSPIKFYEYLSYGKPIICSQMSEIEQYTNNYIGCYKDDKELSVLIKRFMNDKVKKEAKQNSIKIVNNNSWLSRVELIDKYL